jgi:hypothetical protein
MTSNDNFFEEIPEDAVPASGKGRKPNPVTVSVADALRNVKNGKALAIPGLAIVLNGKDAEAIKREKARIGAILRSAARLANVKISVIWNGGTPTVKILGRNLDGNG